ncbi:MAG: 20S proteasome subunit A/B [Gammaproteobacteria bacterium]
MTYCVAIKINEGLVFASDSRTNAGLDNISSYSKMLTFNVGDRAFVILTSGNLATSQAVYHRIEKDLSSSETIKNLNTCEDLEEVASYIGELNLEYQSLNNDNLSQSSISLGSHFIVGGQIKGQNPSLMLVYPEGNYIHMSDDQPYLQIGEIKYGKPILDRMINNDMSIGDAARVALLSLDSTMRSDLTVGPPIDLVVFKRNEFNLNFKEQLKLDSPFFKELSDIWATQIEKGVKVLPKFQWE